MTKPRTKRTPYPWSYPEFPYRVFFYPGSGGTRCQYFTTRTEAESFAVGRICWGEPARVDEKQVAS